VRNAKFLVEKPDSTRRLGALEAVVAARRAAESLASIGSKPLGGRLFPLRRYVARARRSWRILKGGDYAAGRLRDEDWVRRAAIRSGLLASTAAPTESSKRSRPRARQLFMPAREQHGDASLNAGAEALPFLKAGLFS
jgi:hypothetical protein